MNYLEYGNYKYSGSDLLGNVPNTWEVKKLKYVIKIIQTGTTPSTTDYSFYDGEINWFNPKDLNHEVLRNSEKKLTQIAIDKGVIKLFPGNSILIVGIGATTGKTAYLKHSATFNQQITGFKSLQHNNKFLFYLLKSMSGVFLKIANYTTLPILNNEFFKSFLLSIPPNKEQQIIVSFLDQKTSEIDALIAKKEKLINLLEEKRTALITQAVTKGLEPNVPMKDSGVEWMGDIPEIWTIKRLRFCSKTNPAKPNFKGKDEQLVSFIPMEAISEDGMINTEESRPVDEVLQGYTYFADGDVIIAKITPCFENGKGALARGLLNNIAFGTTELHVVRVKSLLISSFLFYISISYPFRKIGEANMYGAGGQKRISDDFIKDFVIPLPSLDEQKLICDFLAISIEKIEKTKCKVIEIINRLKEYRSALITNAVTGKIKVPNQEVLNEYTKSNESTFRTTG